MRFFNQIILIAILSLSASYPAQSNAAEYPLAGTIQKPTLLWLGGGCSNGYCQTSWYSSPAVSNLDGDPQAEVIGAAYSIFVLDGVNGRTQASVKSGHDITQPNASDVGRTWPDIALANLDGVGSVEIITAHSGGWVSAYTNNLTFLPNWPNQPTPGNELRSLGVSNLDANADFEILVASTRAQDQWYAYEHTGQVRAAYWPQHSPDSDTNGYTHGGYNQNLAAGDLDGDGRGEIVGPNDTHYIAAFQDDGQQIRANSLYGLIGGNSKYWSRVGVHVDHVVDLRGYANYGVEHRPNFAHSAPIIVDLDGSGTLETVVIGNVYNCGTSPYTDLYEIPFIFKGDRTRWSNGTYNWTVLPSPEPGSRPLNEDYNLIENTHPNPSAADLDNDDNLEVIFPSYDGRMHVYWLDKTQHGNWPYSVKKANENFIRFATEAVVADLDNDGQAEVIFASWTQKGSNQTGKLHILSSLGAPIWEVNLPGAMGESNWNGALAAPTLANIDLDADLEIVLNTVHSGLVAYDLPGTANARILWGTGRGSYLRSGALNHGYIAHPTMLPDKPTNLPGDLVTFTIVLRSLGTGVSNAEYSNTLPAALTYVEDSLSPGSAHYTNGTITWNGNLPIGQPVTITYQAQISNAISLPTRIMNYAQLSDGLGAPLQFHASTNVHFTPFYLPLAFR